jgi:hypothetical protein
MLMVSPWRFPEIMEEVQAMLQQTKDELQMLPDPPSDDPALELMHLVNEISDDIHKLAEGFNLGHSRENQFEGIRQAHDAFKSKIRATAPHFRPSQANPAVEAVVECSPGVEASPRPLLRALYTDVPRQAVSVAVPQEVVYTEVPRQAVYTEESRESYSLPKEAYSTKLPREVSSDEMHTPPQPTFFMFNEGATSSSTQAPINLDEVVQKVLKCVPGSYVTPRTAHDMQSYNARIAGILPIPRGTRPDIFLYLPVDTTCINAYRRYK